MDDDTSDVTHLLQISGMSEELKHRIRLAAIARGVSMSRYLIDLVDPLVPPLPRR